MYLKMSLTCIEAIEGILASSLARQKVPVNLHYHKTIWLVYKLI